jgi:hypothetical protein
MCIAAMLLCGLNMYVALGHGDLHELYYDPKSFTSVAFLIYMSDTTESYIVISLGEPCNGQKTPFVKRKLTLSLPASLARGHSQGAAARSER